MKTCSNIFKYNYKQERGEKFYFIHTCVFFCFCMWVCVVCVYPNVRFISSKCNSCFLILKCNRFLDEIELSSFSSFNSIKLLRLQNFKNGQLDVPLVCMCVCVSMRLFVSVCVCDYLRCVTHQPLGNLIRFNILP